MPSSGRWPVPSVVPWSRPPALGPEPRLSRRGRGCPARRVGQRLVSSPGSYHHPVAEHGPSATPGCAGGCRGGRRTGRGPPRSRTPVTDSVTVASASIDIRTPLMVPSPASATSTTRSGASAATTSVVSPSAACGRTDATGHLHHAHLHPVGGPVQLRHQVGHGEAGKAEGLGRHRRSHGPVVGAERVADRAGILARGRPQHLGIGRLRPAVRRRSRCRRTGPACGPPPTDPGPAAPAAARLHTQVLPTSVPVPHTRTIRSGRNPAPVSVPPRATPPTPVRTALTAVGVTLTGPSLVDRGRPVDSASP